MVFFYKVGNDIVSLTFITAFINVLMAVGVFAKGLKPKLKNLVGLLIAAAVVLQIALFSTKLALSIVAYKIVLLYSASSFIVTIWLILLFFTFDKEEMTALKKKDNKKINVYSVLEIVLVFAMMFLLHNYYHNQINALLVSGTTNRSDGLSAAQVMGLIDAKILQVDLLQTVFLIVVGGLNLMLYRKWLHGKDSRAIEHQP